LRQPLKAIRKAFFSPIILYSRLFALPLRAKLREDRLHFGKIQIKIWFFAQFALPLQAKAKKNSKK